MRSGNGRATVAVFVAWLGALAAACGGKAVIDAGEGGNDPAAGDGGKSADPFDGVSCGDAGSCTFSCCLDLSQQNAAPFCATDCGFGIGGFSCDGPEDCDGGVCCGTVTGSSCKPTCDFGELRRCHTSTDCGGPPCEPASVAGVDMSRCG